MHTRGTLNICLHSVWFMYISLTELLCYVCFNVKVLKHSLQVFMSCYGDIVNGLDPLDFLMTLRSLVNIRI